MAVGEDIPVPLKTPTLWDGKRVLWVKKLWTIQSLVASPKAANNPARHDGIRQLREKCVRAVEGL